MQEDPSHLVMLSCIIEWLCVSFGRHLSELPPAVHPKDARGCAQICHRLILLLPRGDVRSGGSPSRSPTRTSTSPIRLPSSSPTRRPSSSPIRNPSDSSWRNSTSSNYAKLPTSSSTSATGSSWQARTSSSSFSASKAFDSTDSYSFSSKAADSSYGSWGRNSGRDTSTSPKSSFSTSRSPGSGRIGLSALK